MNLMARREHSRRELQKKLEQRGCPIEFIDTVLDKLERDGLLSDERFTESLITTRRSQGHGPLRIRHDLKQKGVATPIIHRWLDERSDEWMELIQRVRRQKFGGMLPGDLKERARQARFLQSRGFTAEQIHKTLKDDE